MIVVRDREGGGVDVLVVERSAASRFAPGFVVFPGGAVEDGDRELARRRLGSAAELDRACAIRELSEETGLVLGEDGRVRAARGTGLDGSSVRVEALPEIAHWIAPEFLPVRFDARFFAALAARDAEPIPDGVEVRAAWWASPVDVLQAHRAGEAALMWPTLVMVQALGSCHRAREVMRLRVEQAASPAGARPPAAARDAGAEPAVGP
jgi:8-oxo-dGTP pyrophosphatase MutT (NUDIX family)